MSHHPAASSRPRRSGANHKKTPAERLEKAVQQKIAELQLPSEFGRIVDTIHREIADALLLRHEEAVRQMIVGICGCQGSGKSTLATFLKLILEDAQESTAVLSLDDLYLTRREREKLARDVHPLLRTRGVPGTHDVPLGLQTFARLRSAASTSRTPMPRFDKALDDRVPRKQWMTFTGRPKFILLEGWCVDARPQPEAALLKPINALERECDPDGPWRRYVNAQLAGPYRTLFGPIDILLFLQAPSFDCVYNWRGLQENKLRVGTKKSSAGMDGDALKTFIMHYERLTRWMLKEVPPRADILLRLGPDQDIRAVQVSRNPSNVSPS